MSCSKFLKQRPVPWKSETTNTTTNQGIFKKRTQTFAAKWQKSDSKKSEMSIFMQKILHKPIGDSFSLKKVTLWIDRPVFADDSKEGKTVAPSMKKFRRILWRRFVEFCEEVSSELFPGLLNFSETESSIFDCEIFGRAAFDVQYILFLNS